MGLVADLRSPKAVEVGVLARTQMDRPTGLTTAAPQPEVPFYTTLAEKILWPESAAGHQR